IPNSLAFSAITRICSMLSGSGFGLERSVVGMLWSTTASVFCGARTLRPEALEGLRRGHLMHEMAVDIEQAGAVLGFVDQMVVPDLVVQRGRFGHELSSEGNK